ncbi:unnamed protein product [Owenia fusiformis]|uniref:Uncharacterized protein n=1 Tax=Owenia fusiformis TaxID=6347 RepID=A0A8J1Y1H6_OWEFU|nr:unnamed protein product [Owenia fusiformis]
MKSYLNVFIMKMIIIAVLCFVVLFGTFKLGTNFPVLISYRNDGFDLNDLRAQMDIEILRKYWLIPPSVNIEPNMNDHDFSQVGQSKVVDKILNGKTNGIYIECGASDGHISNTEYFENYRNWIGLLVEPTPEFEGILKHDRNAWLLNACIGINQQIQQSIIQLGPMNWGWSGLQDAILPRNIKKAKENKTSKIIVQCFPFSTILKALNWTTIDYFSLDVEGAEEAILETIPFDDVHIRVFTIEFSGSGSKQEDAFKLDRMRQFFTQRNYTEWGVLGKDGSFPLGLDVVFHKL